MYHTTAETQQTDRPIYNKINKHTQQSSSCQMPTYYIDIQVIIIQVSVQRDIAVTELNNHACRTSESSLMIGYFLAY